MLRFEGRGLVFGAWGLEFEGSGLSFGVGGFLFNASQRASRD